MMPAVEGQTITSLLAPGGAVAQVFEGFEARRGQLVMAEAVQAALDDDEPVLVEAPCGIGKSLTYLLGAALAAQDGRKTLVVTANIALQEQLIRKDLPLVQRAFPKLTYALAKGINNYFCPRNFHKGRDEGLVTKLNRSEREQWRDLEDRWTERWSGDLSDLDYELLPSVKNWVTTTSDDCPGRKCRMAAECPARKAKKLWHASDVVVTNYHLFFIYMAMGHGVLPDWDFLVLDEAHKLGDIAREFFGRRASRGSVRACVNLLDFAPDEIGRASCRERV